MRWTHPHGEPLLRAAVVALLAPLLVIAVAGAASGAPDPFPPATPESQGMSAEALDTLADIVQGYVDREMAVGAELLVIKDRRTVLHEAFGWRDREAGVPMEPDTLFNIRSMTKPITGAAAQILIDEGRLALDDRVSEHLPGFDNEASVSITVEQLLTHRSGLPLSTLAGTRDHVSLEAMANAIGEGGPEFEPGTRFWYSDAGAEALGAVVEQASGQPLGDLVTERLLQPLGMVDTYYPSDPADARVGRIASLYIGSVGNWNRFWEPHDEPLYPFPWGSQGLYGSPRDYARFLAMWMDDGLAGDDRILSPEAVARTLTPVVPMGQLGSDAPYPTLFPGLTVYHGQMALLHVPTAAEGEAPSAAAPVIIGYSGSDGTIAWAWPERDLMILYFTQSRGGVSPIRLEAEIDRLLLHPSDELAPTVPAEYADLLGTYSADFGPFVNEPFEIVWRDGGLALDIPSQLIVALDRAGREARWTFRDDPRVSVTFVRDEAGQVTGLRITQDGEVIDLPRGLPEAAAVLRPADAEPYLGWYRETGTEREVEVVFQAGRLALRIPETSEPLELLPPASDGGRRLAISPTTVLRFREEDGSIVGYSVSGPGGTASFIRIDEPRLEGDG